MPRKLPTQYPTKWGTCGEAGAGRYPTHKRRTPMLAVQPVALEVLEVLFVASGRVVLWCLIYEWRPKKSEPLYVLRRVKLAPHREDRGHQVTTISAQRVVQDAAGQYDQLRLSSCAPYGINKSKCAQPDSALGGNARRLVESG
eukprot:GEMP01029680.1.p2 GENE.GEMP01029680.1~~GEMP01029680.1.p2  ORF type:complete len:143 (+),score=28.84 GEMP01029680.1:595-1023(+)